MAELSYAAIQAMLRRLASGETTVEAESRQHRPGELIAALRMTRGMLLAIPMAWSDEQVAFQPPAPASVVDTGPQTDPATQSDPGMAAAGQGAAGGEGDHWSASEILTHLMATQNWYLMNMTRLVGRREHYAVMPRGLGDHARPGVPAATLASDLRDATTLLLEQAADITPTADLDTTRDSIFFGGLSQRGWLMLAIVHDAQHFEQIQRLSQLPTFPHA